MKKTILILSLVTIFAFPLFAQQKLPDKVYTYTKDFEPEGGKDGFFFTAAFTIRVKNIPEKMKQDDHYAAYIEKIRLVRYDKCRWRGKIITASEVNLGESDLKSGFTMANFEICILKDDASSICKVIRLKFGHDAGGDIGFLLVMRPGLNEKLSDLWSRISVSVPTKKGISGPLNDDRMGLSVLLDEYLNKQQKPQTMQSSTSQSGNTPEIKNKALQSQNSSTPTNSSTSSTSTYDPGTGRSSSVATTSGTPTSSSVRPAASTRQERVDAEHRDMMNKQRAEYDQKADALKAANIAASNRKVQQSQSNLDNAWTNFENAAVGIARQRAADRAAREAYEAREAEERKRAEAERIRIEAEHRTYVGGMRNSLITNFEDGKIPLSSDNVDVPELWYFAWRGDRNTLQSIYVTDVFPIARYSDGSYPFKNAVVGEINDAGGTGEVTLVGWFATREQAQRALNEFIETAQAGEVNIRSLVYKGKPKAISTNASDNDFWGTGSPSEPAKKKDNFWD